MGFIYHFLDFWLDIPQKSYSEINWPLAWPHFFITVFTSNRIQNFASNIWLGLCNLHVSMYSSVDKKIGPFLKNNMHQKLKLLNLSLLNIVFLILYLKIKIYIWVKFIYYCYVHSGDFAKIWGLLRIPYSREQKHVSVSETPRS